MGNPDPVRPYSAAEYLALEDAAEYRSEYYGGEILSVAGATIEHDLIAGEMHVLLRNALRGGPCKPLTSNLKVSVQASSSYFYPDLSVVCGEPVMEDLKRTILTNPLLIVEVLSDSTEAFDRGEKFQAYKRISSLREYVLITQRKPQIDVFFKTEGGFWRLDSYSGLDDTLQLRSLDIQLRLADIYGTIRFSDATE